MKVEQVKKVFEEANRKVQATVEAFPWENQEAYLGWLAQTLEYVTYTTRILALTGAHFPLDKTSIASRFIQHATEEKGHDKLLHRDAAALGMDLSKIPVSPEAEAFHKSVYFWIYQGQPAVVMGWVIFLEGFAVRNGKKLHERAEAGHGKKAVSFLKVHTQEDPEHLEMAFKTLEAFSEKELEDVAHGIELYGKLYENVYKGICEQVAATRKAA